jgi:hypothetical protein
MNNLSYRDISNTRVSSRMRQLAILALVIVIGMLISVSVTALPTAKTAKASKTAMASTPGTLPH